VPGPHFHFDGPEAPQVQLFYSIYFCMTGLHALHMVIGVGVLGWLVVRQMRAEGNPLRFVIVGAGLLLLVLSVGFVIVAAGRVYAALRAERRAGA